MERFKRALCDSLPLRFKRLALRLEFGLEILLVCRGRVEQGLPSRLSFRIQAFSRFCILLFRSL